MDIGIHLPTKATSWEVAKRAEELGYTHAWFYDTHLLNAELFAAMGAAAMKTSKIKLCTGVMIPSNRFAPVAASGLATLNALAPGRIVFGVSTGYTGRRTMGLKPVTQARMDKYIKVVQGLLAGKTVDWDEEAGTHKVRFLNPELGLVNIKDPIPLAISAFGPKGRANIAEMGAQWIGSATYPQREQAEIDEVRGHWAKSGRDPKTLYAISAIGGRVLDEGEPADSPKAMAQAGPYAAIGFHNLVEEKEYGSVFPGEFPFPAELEAYRKVYEKYEPADARYLTNHRGHLMFVRPEEKHLSAPIIQALSMTDTKARLIERLKGIKAMGYHQALFHIVPGHENDMLERWADVMAKV